MDERIYDVLCDIKDELQSLRWEVSELKSEVKSICGVAEYSKDLYDVCSKLDDIESAINYK
jgi:hypothetical protein